mgnify:FL=1|jgi:hypothetical protein
MASTYSDRLRLELIGTGEQSGTWGATTNTNLGTLLDQAIAGMASITMTDANYTLSNLNGSSDEARRIILKVGGTNSASRDVICPAKEKFYTVYNNTTGGFPIVLKTSGGTGFTIPNGYAATVWCDATDCFSANDYNGVPTGSITDNVSGELIFSTVNPTTFAATEVMRFDTDKDILINTTSSTSVSGDCMILRGSADAVGPDTNNNIDIGHAAARADGSLYARFRYDGTAIGQISQVGSPGTSVNYGTTSDRRMKKDIVPMENGVSRIEQLNPVYFIWKSSNLPGQGFIADELQQVFPDAVTGQPNAVDSQGNPVYQNVDTSYIVATLCAAVQELKSELDSVKAELETLKSG